MPVVSSLGVFLVLVHLHLVTCQFRYEDLHRHFPDFDFARTFEANAPVCVCKAFQPVYTHRISPRRNLDDDNPTDNSNDNTNVNINTNGIDPSRRSVNDNSNSNTNTNTFEMARRALNQNSNTNINSNGFIPPKYHHEKSHKRHHVPTTPHARSQVAGKRHRPGTHVIVQADRPHLEVIGDPKVDGANGGSDEDVSVADSAGHPKIVVTAKTGRKHFSNMYEHPDPSY